MKTTIALVLGFLVLAFVGILFMRSDTPTTQTERTNREVALACTTDMATEFHIHAVLKIIANGEQQAIPADIGVRPGCMNALHTHDTIGTIHVESPEKRDFTLADFFAVWEQPFSKDQILGFNTDASHTIRVTVNGVNVDSFENTILKDTEEIVISYEKL